MRVRGRRRCRDCGEEWSYYEVGSVECPTCGSLRSVGTDEEPALHTDAPVALDLVDLRGAIDARPLREIADEAETVALEYVSARGFLNAGELRSLDSTMVAASQLRHVAAHLRRSLQNPPEDVEAHFLALLRGAPDGERPETVPEALRGAYGLAIADVVDRYRSEVSTWLAENQTDLDPPLESLREHTKRIEALDGEVPPEEADALLAAAREVGDFLREGDETALARAEERLGELA